MLGGCGVVAHKRKAAAGSGDKGEMAALLF